MYVLRIKEYLGKVILFKFIVLLLISPNLHAQLNDFKFEQILSDEGLSQNTVHSIIQDRQGFLWFATEDGLNKYDGYKFTVYKNDANNNSSLSDNFIWTVCEGKDGALWVGTNSGGLSRFNRITESFTNYKHNPENPESISNNNIRAMLEDKHGDLWIGTEGGGLEKLDENSNKFIHYVYNPKDRYSISSNNVFSLFEDKEGNLWIGTDNGLNKYDREKKQFIKYTYNSKDPSSLSNNTVISILEDKAGNLWVGTLNGLNKFIKHSGRFIRYYLESYSSSVNNINAILQDKLGTIWIGSGGGGLYQYSNGKDKPVKINQIPFSTINIRATNVLSLYEDNSGIIWIGASEGGIIKFDRKRMNFKHYKNDPLNPNSLSYNTVRAICEEKSGVLWIGTLGGGLNKFNIKKNKFVHYLHNPHNKNSISDNSITTIYKDKDGFLWVGTWGGGLDRLDLKKSSASFIHYTNNPDDSNSLSNNIVQKVFEDAAGNLWIGTGTGLDRFDRNKKNFIHSVYDPNNPKSISSNLVQSCIIQDKEGNFWIGTWDGLNKIVMTKDSVLFSNTKLKFIRYKHNPSLPFSLSDNRIISAYQDESGNLWFGTHGGGLNKLSVEQQKVSNPNETMFVHYSIKNGLPSTIVYGILSDNYGNIWISTDNGLSKFNPKSETFKNYFKSDGLQGNQFYWGASCKASNGDLIFGGANGFNIFNPFSLQDNTHVPPVFITDFQIFNKPVSIGGKDSPLQKTITATDEIELSYSQNVFSFEFAALDYTIPQKNQYAYMMEGFDKGWILSNNRRYVTYTNLDQGEYVFRVRGSNNDGVWNNTGASIKIKILPPFWKTWWFILTFVIVAGGLTVFFITYRVRHLLDIERLRTKLAADLHDNIGSSLTEISILSEVISKKIKNAGEDVTKSLNMISNTSRNLIDAMSDIVWLVNPSRDSLYDLILRLRDTYTELSTYASISFRSENLKSLEKVSLSMEHRQHLYLIFKEGINNSITHSGCSEISLDAYVKGKRLEMVLKDNGKGFNSSNASNGNGLVNIKKRAETIGGILRVNSKPGEGTTILFIGNIS